MKSITPDQVKQIKSFVGDSSYEAITIALEQLQNDHEITLKELQLAISRSDRLKSKLIPFFKELVKELGVEAKPFTKSISRGKKITITATDGTETLAEAGDVFAYIDPDFNNWGCNIPTQPTQDVDVEVRELINDGKFTQIFGSFDVDLEKLVFTPAQIKSFAKNHRDWLRTEVWATFFLFKVGNEFFVVRMYVDGDGRLMVDVFRFSRDRVWDAESRLRIVVPQLDTVVP